MKHDLWTQRLSSVVREDAGRAYLVALRAVGSTSLAEDIVQEAYLKMLKRPLPQMSNAQLRVYFLKVVRGTAINSGQAVRSRKSHEERYVSTQRTELSPDEKSQRSETVSMLQELMGRLPGSESEAVSLRYEQGLTLQECSKILSVPAQTVATRTRRGLERLRERLTAKGMAAISAAGIVEIFQDVGVPPAPTQLLNVLQEMGNGLQTALSESARQLPTQVSTGSVTLTVKLAIGSVLVLGIVAGSTGMLSTSGNSESSLMPLVPGSGSPGQLLAPGPIYSDTFKLSSPDPFWEKMEPQEQFVFNSRDDQKGGLEIQVGQLKDGKNFKTEAEIHSKQLPLGGRPVEILINRHGSVGVGVERGVEILDGAGKRVAWIGKRASELHVQIGDQTWPFRSVASLHSYRVIVGPEGQVFISDQHSKVAHWFRHVGRRLENISLRLFAKSGEQYGIKTAFKKISIRRLSSWPSIAKGLPKGEVLWEEDFTGTQLSSFWLKSNADSPAGISMKDSWLVLRVAGDRRNPFEHLQEMPSMIIPRHDAFSGQTGKVFGKQIELVSKAILLEHNNTRYRSVDVMLDGSPPRFGQGGSFEIGFELLDQDADPLFNFQIRQEQHSTPRAFLEVGGKSKLIGLPIMDFPPRVQVSTSGQLTVWPSFGSKFTMPVKRNIKSLTVRLYARIVKASGGLVWPIDRIIVQASKRSARLKTSD